MTNYIVFNETGDILRTGTCPSDMLFMQAANDGEFVMEGIADDSIHKIANGKIVLK